MSYTFANRTVALVGAFKHPIELIQEVVSYLGGTVVHRGVYLGSTNVIIIGANTDYNSISAIEQYFSRFNPIIVYEYKLEDHMYQDDTLGDTIDKVKINIPWSSFY